MEEMETEPIVKLETGESESDFASESDDEAPEVERPRKAAQPAAPPTPWTILEPPEKSNDKTAAAPAPKKPKVNGETFAQREIKRKFAHPAKLHAELAFNERGQQHDGPECKCYAGTREMGVMHGEYPGETAIPFCDLNTNNADRLYHYVVEVSPDFPLTKRQRSAIYSDCVWYTFAGFSLFVHQEVPPNLPLKWLNRMLPEFGVRIVKAPPVQGFCVEELELYYRYVFEGLLELYDLERGDTRRGGCPFFHVMPRYIYVDEVNGTTIHNLLPMATVLRHLTDGFRPLADVPLESGEQRRALRGHLMACPSKRPSALRADDFVSAGGKQPTFLLAHATSRPTTQASRARNLLLAAVRKHRALHERLQQKHRLTNAEVAQLEEEYEETCQEIKRLRYEKHQKSDFTLHLPLAPFFTTGMNADVAQHAMFLLPAVWRIRYHWALRVFEQTIGYSFKNRLLLELALTNPSHLTNYGTNPDHARNSLRNCGLRSIRDKRKFHASKEDSRRKGINTLMKIMSSHGSKDERQSTLHHNERLEFLGDAVVELVVSNHLFFMLPYAEEGVLASHRSRLVRNLNLGKAGRKLRINEFLLYAHGVDLSVEEGMHKAMANAFEALMAAIYLDSNIDESDRSKNSPSDRHWIEKVRWLQKLTELEQHTGVFFHHIRVLARAFTRRNVGFNTLTQGHNQRLEFLGDTVLQFFISDYLYRHFPRHQEGHLSLLRSCLVSNRTQSVICDDLRLTEFLFDPRGVQKAPLTMKDKADLVEAYLAAIFVDRGYAFCEVFCHVCFVPRLRVFIRSSRWNDPKSQLQQCCLTLRRGGSGSTIPVYKTVGIQGPTNTRLFRVLVFFRNKRLASGTGYTIHEAELNAAENALIRNAHLFVDFDLESTYLGARIRAYDDEVQVKEEPMDEDEEEPPARELQMKAEPMDDEAVERPAALEDGELPQLSAPVPISSDEDSDDPDG
ncbi:Ribonuclease 3 [Aphelenchoides fujianensis]|nr:Ribonuclease 3 [Aphelenchoides fujianensis]